MVFHLKWLAFYLLAPFKTGALTLGLVFLLTVALLLALVFTLRYMLSVLMAREQAA